MVKVKTIEESARRYAKNSIRAFIEGGKYARDKKPKNIKWLSGVIRSSGVSKEELLKLFKELEGYPKDSDERERFIQAKQKVEPQ